MIKTFLLNLLLKDGPKFYALAVAQMAAATKQVNDIGKVLLVTPPYEVEYIEELKCRLWWQNLRLAIFTAAIAHMKIPNPVLTAPTV